jgi:hypothetical protein
MNFYLIINQIKMKSDKSEHQNSLTMTTVISQKRVGRIGVTHRVVSDNADFGT